MSKLKKIAEGIESERERLITEASKIIAYEQNLPEDFILETALEMAKARNITVEEAIKKRFFFDVKKIKALENMEKIKKLSYTAKNPSWWSTGTAGRPTKESENE